MVTKYMHLDDKYVVMTVNKKTTVNGHNTKIECMI